MGHSAFDIDNDVKEDITSIVYFKTLGFFGWSPFHNGRWSLFKKIRVSGFSHSSPMNAKR